MLRITFLGTAGSKPTPNRNPSAILINRDGELMLFDCGEGTQQQMMRAKTGMMALSSIFITHFHADHILGIPGLIQTMAFQRRKEPLTIYGPYEIEEFTEHLFALSYRKPKFEINTIRLRAGDVIKKKDYAIHAIKTQHSVPSLGYALIENKRKGRFNVDAALNAGIPKGYLFSRLQQGETVTVNGKSVHPDEVIGPPRPGRTIVYSGDTLPCKEILNASKNADVLIHDATLASDLIDWANETMHTTAKDAAILAKDAGVRSLILTHFSSRYDNDTTPLLNDAKQIFKNVIASEDLMEIEVPYRDE
ncbi:MAG: ribonuclease Z [Methanosarcinaceae archaeon]|jgi:ribonuclease Z|nr:ribonuclease Z [Methanosarcinaceae archaeon]NKQ38008.1 ribonuclease Z [Methanosarcinales archaeon]